MLLLNNVFLIAATKENTFFCFAERVLIIRAAVLQMPTQAYTM